MTSKTPAPPKAAPLRERSRPAIPGARADAIPTSSAELASGRPSEPHPQAHPVPESDASPDGCSPLGSTGEGLLGISERLFDICAAALGTENDDCSDVEQAVGLLAHRLEGARVVIRDLKEQLDRASHWEGVNADAAEQAERERDELRELTLRIAMELDEDVTWPELPARVAKLRAELERVKYERDQLRDSANGLISKAVADAQDVGSGILTDPALAELLDAAQALTPIEENDGEWSCFYCAAPAQAHYSVQHHESCEWAVLVRKVNDFNGIHKKGAAGAPGGAMDLPGAAVLQLRFDRLRKLAADVIEGWRKYWGWDGQARRFQDACEALATELEQLRKLTAHELDPRELAILRAAKAFFDAMRGHDLELVYGHARSGWTLASRAHLTWNPTQDGKPAWDGSCLDDDRKSIPVLAALHELLEPSDESEGRR